MQEKSMEKELSDLDITVRVSIDVLNQNVQELESFGEEME